MLFTFMKKNLNIFLFLNKIPLTVCVCVCIYIYIVHEGNFSLSTLKISVIILSSVIILKIKLGDSFFYKYFQTQPFWVNRVTIISFSSGFWFF